MAVLAKAPIVELIVEVHWNDPQMIEVQEGRLDPSRFWSNNRNVLDTLHIVFGSKVRSNGFTRVERVHPDDFPCIGRRVVHRYRNTQQNTLYQIGPGIFSANASPPYQTWSEFLPTVEQGLVDFIASIGEVYEDVDPTLDSICLRYIDAFNREHLANRSPLEFIREDLGFGLVLPNCLKGIAPGENEVSPRLELQFNIPGDKGTFALVIGQGTSDGKDAVIMESSVKHAIAGKLELQIALDELNQSQEIAGDFFKGLISGIQERFQ